MNKQDLLEVALIGRSVGLKGFVKLFDRSDFPNQFKKGATFYDDNRQELIVNAYEKNSSTIQFVGYDTIEKAKTLTNKTLYSTYEATKNNCKLKKGEYFYFDIIDCKIIENNETLGVVINILDMPIGYLFEILTDTSLTKDNKAKVFHIPYMDKFIDRIDISDKKIYTNNAKDILINS